MYRNYPKNLKEKTEGLEQFILQNKALTGYWIILTGILLYQHSLGWNWDFLVYLMNGEYIFHGGHFMEWLRPPIASVIMGSLQFIFSRPVSGYIYIFTVSMFFLYAAKRFSESEGLDLLVFAVLISTPAFIAFSTREGTEMLSLAFIMLFLTDLNGKKSGLWLGLSIFTRWTHAIMAPILLLQKNRKKILKTGLIASAVSLPWIIYSYSTTGDILASPVSFIALNVLLRGESSPPQLVHFAVITVPAILVLSLAVKDCVREKMTSLVKENRISWAIIYITGATGLIYFLSDITHLRYLYPLVLPVAFFGTKILKDLETEKLIYGFMAMNLVFGLSFATSTGFESSRPYQDASENIECMVESDSWVPLNYAGLKAQSPVDSNVTRERIRKGWRILDFTGELVDNEIEKTSGKLIRDMGTYKIYGNPEKCAEPQSVDTTRIDEYNLAEGTNFTETGFILNYVGLR